MIRNRLARLAIAGAMAAGVLAAPSAAHADINVGDVNVVAPVTVLVHDVLQGVKVLLHVA